MNRRFTRRDALKMLGASLASLPHARRALAETPFRPAQPAVRPNIVFIMTDDQRQDAMSAYGNPILRTPNMDAIGAGGMRFTEFFVTNSLCQPSRASFLTGLYSHAHGVLSNGGGPDFADHPGLRPDQQTFVHLLREAGYRTALVGKWHMPSLPTGFDDWVIFPGQGRYHDPDMIANGARVRMRGHADDVTGDQALEFLRTRPKRQPFCLLYQFKSPHRSWMPAERYAHVFDDVDVPIPRTFEDRLAGRPEALKRAEMAIADMPDFANRGVLASLPVAERKRLNLEHLVKNYYRVLLSVDENVGRLLNQLEADGIADNTIVMFTSDNGFFLGEHGLFDKRLMYEPSIRVPMLVRYPARIRPGQVDTTHMALNIDVAPTLLELAGLAIPSWMHGRSMAPLLTGGSIPWREDFLYEYYEYPAEHCVRKNRGVRTNRWKLIHFWEQPEEWELYDLRNDPDETRNLISDTRHAALVRQLRKRLADLRLATGDTDPPGPPPVAKECGNGVNTFYAPRAP
ncbi:MAG TPA: sulfatase [Gemmatimonadaceae bacterium]|nr:sulfatase [Gemmatimonadaceae bacterium]